MEDRFDRFLSIELKKQAKNISEDQYEKLNNVLENLPARKSKKIYYYRAAIIILACLIFSSTGAYAGIISYQRRFEAVDKNRRNELNILTQKSNADADSYSRKLSEQEEYRFTNLLKKYEKGQFPEKELRRVKKISEVEKHSLCYCYENSMLYLPERALSDEEILQIIDLQKVRDYMVKTKSSNLKNRYYDESINYSEINKQKTAIEIAKNFLTNVIKKDITDANTSVKKMRNSYLYKNGDMEDVIIKTNMAEYEFIIVVENDTRTILSFSNNSYYSDDTEYSGKNVKKCLEDAMKIYMYFENNNEPVKKVVSYCKAGKDLFMNKVGFYIYKNAKSGYYFEYGQTDNLLINFERIDNILEYSRAEDRKEKYSNNKNNYIKVRKDI